ncbi:ACP S-malonyltransferase [Microbacterium terrisoli]|uniref:ACP S-malonyltransferase n=1 Tax=Microbacterium terrisoli TaxID=3242192 RepID=UPI0028052BE1|nr:ACP S-malonyltransferase [Microbacterium protaetiae]
MIIAVFPGQGSQTPGFLAPWLESEVARERLQAFSDKAQVDLVAAGTSWDADRIRDTKIAQPLIVAASLLSYAALIERAGTRPQGVAGHSVGELAALAAAEVISSDEALRLVGIRGRAMADAAAVAQTGMSAIVGGDEQDVLSALEKHSLTPANFNGGGQIVAAGALGDLAELAASPPRGTRIIPLKVAGAFHTGYMASAVDTLRTAAATVETSDPTVTLWSNHDGSTLTHGRAAIDRMVAQIASPVRWDLCMASFAENGVTGIIELAPAGTLIGLAKRALRGVPSVAVKTPDDLEAAANLLTGDAA